MLFENALDLVDRFNLDTGVRNIVFKIERKSSYDLDGIDEISAHDGEGHCSRLVVKLDNPGLKPLTCKTYKLGVAMIIE